MFSAAEAIGMLLQHVYIPLDFPLTTSWVPSYSVVEGEKTSGGGFYEITTWRSFLQSWLPKVDKKGNKGSYEKVFSRKLLITAL